MAPKYSSLGNISYKQPALGNVSTIASNIVNKDYGSNNPQVTNTQPIATSTSPKTQNQTPSASGIPQLPTTNPNANIFDTTTNAQITGTPTNTEPVKNVASQPTVGQIQPTGSVIDTLTLAGQDSSFASRQQLAQQYGIQSYQGSPSQNIELEKKFIEAFNQLKGKEIPQTPAEARQELASYQEETQQQGLVNPVQQFMDTYSSMNPIEANLFQQLSGLLSSTNNRQSLRDLYIEEVNAQGLPELNNELIDVQRIMEGTEDDIRSEVAAAGGFVTDSQVQALAGTRNKTLLKQANNLTNIIDAKNEYVDRIVSLTQADRDAVSDNLDKKLGISKTLFDMSNSMTNAARENYKMIVDSVGWSGLAQTVGDNPDQQAYVENLFGLGDGELSALSKYKKPMTEMETLKFENQKLQNLKLSMDITAGDGKNLEFISGTANQPSGVFNKSTGEFTPLSGTKDETMQLVFQKDGIDEIQSLVDSPYLDTAVGPTGFIGRWSPIENITGGKSNFIGSVETMAKQLTIDKLLEAKAQGATFGALSDEELRLVAAAATKIMSDAWIVKDKAGNIKGWDVKEDTFRKELEKINNYRRLDYVLKGGDPASVGIQKMNDGTFWVKNSDETFTQIR